MNGWRWIRLAVAAGALVALLWPAPHREPVRDGSVLARLLGPVASVAASVQWVRFDLALRDGRPELAYARAESALALDPRSVRGWFTLASHLVFDRASLSSEPDPARRRQWIRAGLAVLERGEGQADDPAELAFVRGTIYAHYLARIPQAELAWPGGERAALLAGEQAFERAAQLGDERGELHAELARRALAALR